MEEIMIEKLREMIARCQWTFAKTMPFAPHEYIVRDKCPLTDEEFVYFVDMQRRFGVKERWGFSWVMTTTSRLLKWNYYHLAIQT